LFFVQGADISLDFLFNTNLQACTSAEHSNPTDLSYRNARWRSKSQNDFSI